jgi:MFS family permease
MVIFAIGETMMQPIGGALVNEIAPEHLRGRYNAALGLVWGVAGTLAPLVTALYFSCGAGRWWPLGTAACAVLGGVLMFWVRRLLNAQEDGRTPQNSTVEG